MQYWPEPMNCARSDGDEGPGGSPLPGPPGPPPGPEPGTGGQKDGQPRQRSNTQTPITILAYSESTATFPSNGSRFRWWRRGTSWPPQQAGSGTQGYVNPDPSARPPETQPLPTMPGRWPVQPSPGKRRKLSPPRGSGPSPFPTRPTLRPCAPNCAVVGNPQGPPQHPGIPQGIP